MSTLEERETELRYQLDDLDDWKERYSFILDLADELDPMPEALKVEANKVKGCVSQVWIFPQLRGGRLYFLADSDSLFVKGLVASVLKIYNGATPEQISQFKSNFLIDSGLIQNLSPNRANGVAAMLARITNTAKHMV